MFYKKVIILKIYKFFVKWYYFFCNKNITYNSKECQTDLTNNKIENLLQLEKNLQYLYSVFFFLNLMKRISR